MLVKVIRVKKPNDIRFGTTQIPYDKTFGQVMALLRKHGCTKIAMASDISEDEEINKIAFELNEKSYMIDVPRVFVKKGKYGNYEYNDMIGIRLVYWFLQTMLELVKQRVIDMDQAMLSARMVRTPYGSMTLGEAVESIPPAELSDMFSDREALPESEESEQ
jgi:hypothetical protein